MTSKTVSGFSKKDKIEKINWLLDHYLEQDQKAKETLLTYWHQDAKLQQLHDDFIENTISNYYLPFGVAPNFLINQKVYAIPMVIEESSVVAAVSNAAKFWMDRGGFKAEVISTEKNGQVHLNYFGNASLLNDFFEKVKPKLFQSIEGIQTNMKKRGGGLISLELKDCTEQLDGYYQLHATFETLDAMGANFINSCLEQFAKTFTEESEQYTPFLKAGTLPKTVMSILSNYVPECVVKASVSCPVESLENNGVSGTQFAADFLRAVDIAKVEPRRAVTHNKGIMNGVDAVILATGNDFRAVEAGIHAYASREGTYKSLTTASIDEDQFTFSIEIPLAIGTVGGLTSLHPLAKVALQILQQPTAKELMQIVAVVGLAQNFAALRSLVTSGIQKGHMKMHLMNILNQCDASADEKAKTIQYFENKQISHSEVIRFIEKLRH